MGGLVLSLVIVYFLINYRATNALAADLGQVQVEDIEDEIIPITQQNTPPPPPPPPPQAPEVIEIVEDEEEIEEEIEINTEADAETVVEVFEQEEEVEEDEVFAIVEKMPTFPGGEEKMYKYLQNTIKYPPIAQENGIQGTVYLNFVVGKDGKIRDIKVLRGVDKLLDAEAIRVVKKMPPWKAGKQRGKAVSVTYNLPIKFTLR